MRLDNDQSTNGRNGQNDGPTYSDASPLNIPNMSPSSTSEYRHSFPGNSGAGAGNERIRASASDAYTLQRNNLQHGLELNESGERLGFSFLLDGAQQRKMRPLQDHSSPQHRHSQDSNYPPVPGSQYADPAIASWAAPCRNTPPTCPLDQILLDYLHARQREAESGVPGNRLVGPAYPSVSSLLNPEQSKFSHPLSQVFTDILSKFPDISGLPEQVAVLYVMFLLMRWQVYPTQENYDRLPEWMTPRPSQLFSPHPAWIDYLPWPRMRDKVVANHQDYPFENWFIPYTTTLSLNWRYEPTDTLIQIPGGDDLVINPVFESHLRKLENWSLGEAFAIAQPALSDTAKIKRENRGRIGSRTSQSEMDYHVA